MLVPDGSGSLIHLNNGKTQEEQYVQRVYGADPNDNSLSRPQVSESAYMPVFGLKNGENAWFAVIEKGDGIASISADIGGRQNSYNHVHATFSLRGEDELEMYTSQKMQEIQLLSEEPYRGDIQVRYHFLHGEDASYSGMARLYQQQLIEQDVLKPLAEQTELPFYVDVLGAVDKKGFVPECALSDHFSHDDVRTGHRNGGEVTAGRCEPRTNAVSGMVRRWHQPSYANPGEVGQ